MNSNNRDDKIDLTKFSCDVADCCERYLEDEIDYWIVVSYLFPICKRPPSTFPWITDTVNEVFQKDFAISTIQRRYKALTKKIKILLKRNFGYSKEDVDYFWKLLEEWASDNREG